MLRYILLLLPFFICAFWAVLLALLPDDKHHTKRILAIYMFFSAFMNLSTAFYFGVDPIDYLNFDGIYALSALLVYPLLYLYFVSVTQRSIHSALNLWHFAPALILYFNFQIFSTTLTPEEMEIYFHEFLYARIDSNIFLYSGPERTLSIFFLFIIFVQVIQAFFYTYHSIRILNAYDLRLKKSFSELHNKEMGFFKVLMLLSLVVSILVLVINILGHYFLNFSSYVYLGPTVVIAVALFIIGYLSMNINFTILNLEEEERKAFPMGDMEVNIHSSKISQELLILMEKKKLYLTPDLRITDLCVELKTNRTYLSQVLNDELKENFNSFINTYRVNHAIILLQDKKMDNYSLDKFAELSGFGSTVSMIRAFRQVTGKTPSAYRN